MNPLVFYHANCSDGFCAAWVLRKFYRTAQFLPVNYGEFPAVELSNRDIFILDFSFPREEMISIIKQCKSLVVLDHHKTAEKELADLSAPNATIVFDMNKSGARLTWEYVCKQHQYPIDSSGGYLVDYTEDRDLWRWKLPDSKAVNAAIRSYPMDFKVWTEMEECYGRELMVCEGEAILRAQQQEVDRHVANAKEITFDGHKVLCVNATTLTSEIGEALAKDRPFGMTWFQRSDGMRVFSLRSRGENCVDVSEVAKKYGGGGHRQAAGFQMASLSSYPT